MTLKKPRLKKAGGRSDEVIHFTDDEIFDFFVKQGYDYFGGAGSGALLERCIKHVNGGKYFEMPLDEDFDE